MNCLRFLSAEVIRASDDLTNDYINNIGFMMDNNMQNSSDFNVQIQLKTAIVSVNISRGTLKEANELKNTLSGLINQGFNKIIVDLKQVEYIDSTFIGSLVINLKKIRVSEGRLILINLNHSVSTVVENTMLHKTFDIYHSMEEALKNI